MNGHKTVDFDLLSTVQQGGCSAKIPQEKLTELLATLPLPKHPDILVDIESHDDAGVFRINDQTALILTTDFFPPVCSDAYQFGQIAAANALSDIYAMGGEALLALNIVLFPSATIPMEVLGEILRGGSDKIGEAGAFIMGGHTIEDATPKYGLAVVGTTNPKRLITNSGAREGQVVILTKPLGSGIISAAHKLDMCSEEDYQNTLLSMAQLNKQGARIMQKYFVKGATDITGFGLLGHLLKMGQASGVSFEIHTSELPLFNNVVNLADQGCIPGAAMRNLRFVEENISFAPTVPLPQKMATVDAQTSGGLLICVDDKYANDMLKELRDDYHSASIVGRVVEKRPKVVYAL